MANKYITTSNPGGYGVNVYKYTGFVVSAGQTEGSNPTTTSYGSYYGVSITQISGAPSHSINYGTISGKSGLLFGAAGDFFNFGVINSASGIDTFKYSSTIHNDGLITGSVFLSAAGGAVINGVSQGAPGLIEGGVIAYAGSVNNFTTILGGVQLKGASLVNGGGLDTTAIVRGYDGVTLSGGSVANFGTIAADSPPGAYGGGDGVRLDGGTVSNGAANSRQALIEGYDGVGGATAAATILNFGQIVGLNPAGGAGVDLSAGGRLVNGSPGDKTASITGYAGAVLGASGVVVNYAQIAGSAAQGVLLAAGGRVVNGLGVDRSAIIEGLIGVEIDGAAGTVVNTATIIGDGTTSGVSLSKGGALVNGSATNAAALVEGYSGAVLSGSGSSSNLGTILGLGLSGAQGVRLSAGAQLTNGAASDASGLIEGYVGVFAAGAATLTNFGSIKGDGGTAVDFTSTGDVLALEPGAAFNGSIIGGGGTLDLAAGAWTHAGLLSPAGSITLSGPIATTTFGDFAFLDVGTGTSLTMTGTGAVAGNQGLIIAGTLNVGGAITSAGTLTLTGSLAGAGTLSITGGAANFNGAPSLAIVKTTQSGGTASFGGSAVTISNAWLQTGGTIFAPTGDKVSFSGAGDSFAGTLAGPGTVAFSGGTDAITGATLSGACVINSGAAVTLGGAIKLSGALSVTNTDLAIAAAGATLSGGGSLNLSNLASNAIKGVTASATLTNGDKITGAGTISGLVLVNQTGGVINGDLPTALVINSGAVALANAGVVESTSTGGVKIAGAVVNTGTLVVTKGVLDIGGAVSGAGTVRVGGGTAEFGAGFSESVTFTGTTGVLELAKSVGYIGSVTGLSKSGGTSLDLLDIAFGGSTKATFSGTTASGVLTVTDGTHTAKITLEGNYTTSTFSVFSDGQGGTTVVDPTSTPIVARATAALVSALAGFGATRGVGAAVREFGPRSTQTCLVRPA